MATTGDELSQELTRLVFNSPRQALDFIRNGRAMLEMLRPLFNNKNAIVEAETWQPDKGPTDPNDIESPIGFRYYSNEARNIIAQYQKEYMNEHPEIEKPCIKFEDFANDMSKGENFNLMSINDATPINKAMYNEIMDKALSSDEWKQLKCPIVTKTEELLNREEQKAFDDLIANVNEYGIKNEKNYVPFRASMVRIAGTDKVELLITDKNIMDVAKTFNSYDESLGKAETIEKILNDKKQQILILDKNKILSRDHEDKER